MSTMKNRRVIHPEYGLCIVVDYNLEERTLTLRTEGGRIVAVDAYDVVIDRSEGDEG